MTLSNEQLTRIIESADDVITALAGTNEDCHRESDDMIRLWDYLNDVAAPPAIVKKLAELALAGMEAEPVAWLRESAVNDIHEGAWTPIIQMESQRMGANLTEAWGVSYIPLYSAPQLTTSERAELENYRNAQQVVPEWTNEQCLEFLSIAFRHAEIKGDLEMDDIRLGVKMVNACRAAMLQGAEPVSNRDELPEGWVAVPVEPTTNQWAAGMQAFDSGMDKVTRVYKAMLAAAPQQEAE